MRDKLIKLLDDIQVRGEDFTDYEIYGMRLPNTVSNEDVADHLITNGATIPVRCNDCKHWLKDYPGCTDAIGRCEWANYMVGRNGYCVYGERRTDD